MSTLRLRQNFLHLSSFNSHTLILTVLATNWKGAGMERLHNMESAEKESKKMRGKERIEGKSMWRGEMDEAGKWSKH